MTIRSVLFTAALSLGLGTAVAQDAPAPGPTTYKLGQGTLIVTVMKDESTMAAGLSHNHAVKAVGWHGKFTFDPANPGACQVEATVPVNNLRPDDPESRKYVGIEGEVSEGQREDIKANFLAAGQLDAKNHPNISFKSTGCELSGSTLNLKGNLTVKGKSKAVTIPLGGFSAEGGKLSGKGKFEVKGTDFGVEPYSAMFGQLKNEDKWTFHVALSGKAM